MIYNKIYNFYPYGQIIRNIAPEITNFYILHEGLIGVFDDQLVEKDYDDVEEKKNSKSKKNNKSTNLLKKKSVSKQKKNFKILEKFIENYEFTIKEGEDYYEHDISFDEDKNKITCNIDIVLENDDDKSYPFIQFIVDLSKKKISFNTSSVNSQTYKYQDIDDLKDIIEEEIHRS